MKTNNETVNKRQKECFSSKEIAHVWAHQTAPKGRVSGGNKSFYGGQFNSYYTAIANIITHKGKRAFVIESAKFSVTTSSHQAGVRAAIPDTEQKFFVNCGRRGQSLEFTPQTLRDYYLARFYDKLGEPHKLAHINARTICTREDALESALEVAVFFSLPEKALRAQIRKFEVEYQAAKNILAQRQSKLDASRAKREATEQANRSARAIANANAVLSGAAKIQDVSVDETYLPEDLRGQYVAAWMKFKSEKIALWQAGENVRLEYNLPPLLRREDNEVVTSKGARFPIQDGERAFKFAIARKSGWHRNGETFEIGGYQLDAINEQGVIAGCHRISWTEIERFAMSQGWTLPVA